MIKVATEDLAPGMVLAQKIERADGIMLCNRGTELTSALINTIRRMDLESVLIEGDPFASEEEKQAHIQGLLQELDERFSRVADDPVLSQLKEMFSRKIQDAFQ